MRRITIIGLAASVGLAAALWQGVQNGWWASRDDEALDTASASEGVPQWERLEDEAFARCGSKTPTSAGDLCVAGPCSSTRRWRGAKALWLCIAEGLTRIGERLRVHVLMPDCEFVEVVGGMFNPTG